MSNVKGTTESGFKYEIDPGVLQSWEAMEYLVKIEQGDVAAAAEGFRFIIGSDQLDKVLEFVRKKNGTPYASQEDVLAVANEIVKAAQDAQGEENAKN